LIALRRMKQKIFSLLLLVGLTTLFAGCVQTADGHLKAGVPLVKDSITSRYNRTVDQIMNAARKVLSKGTIQSDDTAAKSLRANIDGRTVWVQITKVDEKISEVVVQARNKNGLGEIYLASELSKQIALELTNQ
jgi:hypothetical protein